MIRVLIVVGVLALFAVVVLLRARSREGPPVDSLRMPDWLTDPTQARWVIFTTPYCAPCGPLADDLAMAFGAQSVVTVDVAEHPDLATCEIGAF